MANQKAISARIDEDIYNMARDYAEMHCTTTNRLINRALEHYLLYEQYQDTAAAEIERQRPEQQHAAGTNDFIIYYLQKMREAAEGDIDAQRAVERHRAYYNQLKAQFKSK